MTAPAPRTLSPGDDLAAALAGAPPGVSLYLAPGRHRFRGPLALAGDVTLAGEDAAATVVEGATDGAVLLAYQGGGRLTLRGLTLRQDLSRGAAPPHDGLADLVVVGNGIVAIHGCRFDRLQAGVEEFAPDWYSKLGGTAIRLREGAGGVVADCLFTRDEARPAQDTVGIELHDRAQLTVTGCTFRALQAGIEAGLGATLTATGNRFERCGDGLRCSYWEDSYDARSVRPHAPRVVTDNAFVENRLGLLIGGPQPGQVVANAFERNARAILVREDGARLERNRFRGNDSNLADPFGRAVLVDNVFEPGPG
jgi:hypothetical protein